MLIDGGWRGGSTGRSGVAPNAATGLQTGVVPYACRRDLGRRGATAKFLVEQSRRAPGLLPRDPEQATLERAAEAAQLDAWRAILRLKVPSA
jgi:hypothetical protein